MKIIYPCFETKKTFFRKLFRAAFFKTKVFEKPQLLCLLLLFLITAPLYPLNITGGHRGIITALIHNGDTVLSSGEDGFLVTWNISQRAAVDRFQLTTHKIQSMIKHPNKNEICIIEAVSVDNYRISAWNYSQKEKLFTIYSNKPLKFINYSAGGNYIIAAGLDGFQLSILDSTTGNVFLDPVIPAGNTALAITGRSERNMLLYQTDHEDYSGRPALAGLIIYYDIQSRSVTGSFQAPGYLINPIVFGNNRFLAGINHDGLQIVDTTTGVVLDNMANIGRNAQLFSFNDEFYCIEQSGSSAVLYRFAVDRNGRLVTRQRIPLSLNQLGAINSIAYNGSFVLASQENILLLGQQNRIIPFTFNFQRRITEIASGEKTIAFFTEDGYFSFIPLDFNSLDNFSLTFTEHSNYNKITSFSQAGEDYYIIWQTDNTRHVPKLIRSSNNEPRNLDFLAGRFPLRTISILNDENAKRFLVLDARGNLTVYSLETLLNPNASAVRPDFTFALAGAIDAAFINSENIIICRSVINNSSPFLSVNIRTGETVPHFFPVQAGLMVYRGRAGIIYGVAIEQTETVNTIFLNITAAGGNIIFKYPSEAKYISITQVSGQLAIICDSEGAKIFTNETIKFERTSGLPVKLQAAQQSFITLDSDGNISWHNSNGKRLAVFSLYENRWTLSGNKEISVLLRP
jgi:WD40 repeat protein